jgi:hypothetical protein
VRPVRVLLPLLVGLTVMLLVIRCGQLQQHNSFATYVRTTAAEGASQELLIRRINPITKPMALRDLPRGSAGWMSVTDVAAPFSRPTPIRPSVEPSASPSPTSQMPVMLRSDAKLNPSGPAKNATVLVIRAASTAHGPEYTVRIFYICEDYRQPSQLASRPNPDLITATRELGNYLRPGAC